MRSQAVRVAALIRIDCLAGDRADRHGAGTERRWRGSRRCSAPRPHHADLFAKRRSNRMKVLVRRHRHLAVRGSAAHLSLACIGSAWVRQV